MNNSKLKKIEDTYWCDHCFTKRAELNDDDEIVETIEFFSCATKYHYLQHLKSKKHKKNVEKEEKNTCPKCNKTFCDAGWELHQKRNDNPLKKCNNFSYCGHRFPSYDSLKRKYPHIGVVYKPIEKPKEEEANLKIKIEKKESSDDEYQSSSSEEEEIIDEYWDYCGLPANRCKCETDSESD